jgi:hypothetical protein
MPSVRPDLTAAFSTIGKLESLFDDVLYVRPRHRQLIAELMIVRLSIAIENYTKSTICKICCGAMYLDGSAPSLIVRQASIARAVDAMKIAGMPEGKQRQLRWNDGPTIRDSIEGIINPLDLLFDRLRAHAATMTELRQIRNQVVHRNTNSKAGFQKVVVRYYGARLRHMTPGIILTTDALGNVPLFKRILVKSRAMVRELSGMPLA